MIKHKRVFDIREVDDKRRSRHGRYKTSNEVEGAYGIVGTLSDVNRIELHCMVNEDESDFTGSQGMQNHRLWVT